MEHELIELYLLVCQLYDNQPVLKAQRLSNFRPRCTDEELVTMYLFGHLQGHTQQRRIYDYLQRHWLAWFPALPSYQAFNRRLNDLLPAFELLISQAVETGLASLPAQSDRLIDSLPVMLARASRARSAKVAGEVADRGYCSSKDIHYHGVKLHALAVRRSGLLPLPQLLWLGPASQHDLSALRHAAPQLGDCFLFGDKAFACADTRRERQAAGTKLATPYKRRRNEPVTANNGLLSRFVSSMRQPLESLFGWLIQRTDLQNASRVRSTKGLLVHCYGKLAVACLLLIFYS